MKLKISLLTYGSNALFLVTYRNGKFFRLEHKSGKMNKSQYKALMMVVPQLSEKLEHYILEYENRVSYEVVEGNAQSVFKRLLDIYVRWYSEQTGILPKIDGIAGRHLKQIIAYLKKQTASDDEMIVVFEQMLNVYPQLPDFYRSQKEIRQINSNINIILNYVKNGKQDNKTQAGNVSNDFRKGF